MAEAVGGQVYDEGSVVEMLEEMAAALLELLDTFEGMDLDEDGTIMDSLDKIDPEMYGPTVIHLGTIQLATRQALKLLGVVDGIVEGEITAEYVEVEDLRGGVVHSPRRPPAS